MLSATWIANEVHRPGWDSGSSKSSQTQPWKANWPNNVSDESKYDPSRFAKSLGGGKGAQPLQNASADGTRVMRLDKIEDFIESLEQQEANGQ